MNKLTQTKDGSYTLYSEHFKEHYHSLHGAVTESNHIFMNKGLSLLKNHKKISILELGFGTGLNTVLTLQHIAQKKIFYHSIEAYPLSQNTLNCYLESLSDNYHSQYQAIIKAPWNIPYKLSSYFTLLKDQSLFQAMTLKTTYDLVYADAFSPRKQPECWSSDIFTKIYNHMNLNAILVSYCSQSKFKKMLNNIGFSVKTLPGPPGKREITQATKIKDSYQE